MRPLLGGDVGTGQKYYAALRDCGTQFVSDEHSLAVLKLVGRAFQDKAKQKLK